MRWLCFVICLQTIFVQYDLFEYQKMHSESLDEIGAMFRGARQAARLTQEQVAALAGITRPRYREIEAGSAAARATTLINIARALGLEMMLVPQSLVPAVNALLRPNDDDDLPAFVAQTDETL